MCSHSTHHPPSTIHIHIHIHIHILLFLLLSAASTFRQVDQPSRMSYALLVLQSLINMPLCS